MKFFSFRMLLLAVCLLAVPLSASASTTVTVKKILASETTVRMLPQETKKILLYATYSDGTIEEVASKAEWISTNPRVADVFQGTITAKQVGSTTIVATYGGKVDTVTADIYPIKKIKRLKLSNTSIKLIPGEKKLVTLEATYEDDTVEEITAKAQWSSTNSEVAQVHKGMISGNAIGTAVIVANYGGKSKTLKAEVVTEKKVTKLKADPASLQMAVDSSKQIILQATYEDGTTANIVTKASWTSSDHNVAEVTNGLISAKSKGKAKVYAEYRGKKATISIHVK